MGNNGAAQKDYWVAPASQHPRNEEPQTGIHAVCTPRTLALRAGAPLLLLPLLPHYLAQAQGEAVGEALLGLAQGRGVLVRGRGGQS